MALSSLSSGISPSTTISAWAGTGNFVSGNAATVTRMPTRRGKAFYIDALPLLNIFEDRTVFHNLGRNRFGICPFIAPAAQQLQRMNIEGQTHCQGKAAQRPIGVGSDPKASR